MIKYTLKCPDAHQFDSWFQSADAFDKLLAAGMTVCPTCGSSEITKALMAPLVRPARSAAPKPAPDVPMTQTASPQDVTTDEERTKALAKLKSEVEANSDYVGTEFAKEARAMHLGESPERAIYGEAKIEDAKSLIEDGIPVAPLPFRPTRKTN
ncbi:MAG: DUF1178 family protein [Pseudoruegeria sp.]